MFRNISEYSFMFIAVLAVGSMTLETSGQARPKFVEYCSLFDGTYGGKTVSSTALMYYSTVGRVDGDDSFLYSAKCNGADYFAIPGGNSKVWSSWQKFFDNLPSERELTLELKFEGTPDVETSYLFGSLDGWARAEIKFSKILSVTDVTFMSYGVLPNFKAAKPNIERIEVMRNKLNIFLESLYSPGSTKGIVSDSLPDEFVFADLSSRTFKKDQYLKLDAPWADLYPSLRGARISSRLKSKTTETMIWRGTLELVLDSEREKTFYCDVTFVLRDSDWILSHATMVRGKEE